MEDTYDGWEDDYMKGFYHETTEDEDAAWEKENNSNEE